MSFFKSLSYSVASTCKEWMRNGRRFKKVEAHIEFLTACKRENVMPKFIENTISPINFVWGKSNHRYGKKLTKLKIYVLNQSITDKYWEKHKLQIKLVMLERKLGQAINFQILQNFYDSQLPILSKIYRHEIDVKHAKFKRLCYKRDTCLDSSVGDGLVQGPKIFNFTTEQVPDVVTTVLSKGHKFNYPLTNNFKGDIACQIINDIETCINKVDSVDKVGIRREVAECLSSFVANNLKHNRIESLLLKQLNFTKKFFKEHDNIIVVKCDKGGGYGILYKDEYIKKVENCFSDANSYQLLSRDPTNKQIQELQLIIKRWKDLKYINDSQFFAIYPINNSISRAYGLVKAHKESFPMRPVVSSIGSPGYRLSKFINKILYELLVPSYPHTVRNSLEFVQSIRLVNSIESDEVMVSLDVVSMYPSIPHDLVEHVLWEQFKANNQLKIPANELMIVIRWILGNSTFKFNDRIYQQVQGCAIGGVSSSIFAELVMRYLEQTILADIQIKFYKRYVDDTFLIIKRSQLTLIIAAFNNFNQALKFTCEEQNDNHLNFLDVCVIREGNNLYTDWFQKEVSSNILLNFQSQHIPSQKRAMVYNLVDRATTLSELRFHSKNLCKVFEILVMNGYPADYVKVHIAKRLRKIKFNMQHCNNSDSITRISVPYVRGLTKKISNIITERNPNIRIVCKSSTLANIVSNHKDKIDKLYNKDVVYKIPCKSCDKVYIGQTRRVLNKRINEHIKNISAPGDKLNSVSRHRLMGHIMDFDNVKILQRVTNNYSRLIAETIHIKLDNTINSMVESNVFTHVYDNVIHMIKKEKTMHNNKPKKGRSSVLQSRSISSSNSSGALTQPGAVPNGHLPCSELGSYDDQVFTFNALPYVEQPVAQRGSSTCVRNTPVKNRMLSNRLRPVLPRKCKVSCIL